jgi:hypothetical protein
VGLITRADDPDHAVSLHRTWFRPDGRKADVAPPRMYLAHHQKRGIVRLYPDDEVTLGLAIAEGVETALTAARAFAPMWAALDATNLKTFPPLPGLEALTIVADHDLAGTAAAQACAKHWYTAGTEVFLVTAPNAGADFNDWVSSHGRR